MNKNPNQQIKQLNFKVPTDFYWNLKNFASTKRLKMGEVLKKAFKFYEKREQMVNDLNNLNNKVTIYWRTIQAIEQQMQPLQGNMNLKELEWKVNNLNPSLFEKIGLVITYQVLKETLTECLKLSRESRLNY